MTTVTGMAIVWASFSVLACLVAFLFYRLQAAEARVKTLEIEMRICKSRLDAGASLWKDAMGVRR